MDHRENPRIAQQHFVDAARRRVAVVGREDVGVEQPAQLRQGHGEVLDQLHGLGLDLGIRLAAVPRHIAQLQAGLGQQGIEGGIEGVADVEILAFLAQVHRPQAHGKQRAAERFENLGHGLARRQLAAALFVADPAITAAPLIPGAAQLADDGL